MPPSIAAYWRWREDRLWLALDAAKRRRDDSLVAWRKTYDTFTNGKAASAQEVAAQQRYYPARQDAESARKAVYALWKL